MKKKVLCFVLVLAMMLVPTAAFADSMLKKIPDFTYGIFQEEEDINFGETLSQLSEVVGDLTIAVVEFNEFLGYKDGDFNFDFASGLVSIGAIVNAIPPAYEVMGVAFQLLNVNVNLKEFQPYVDMLNHFIER